MIDYEVLDYSINESILKDYHRSEDKHENGGRKYFLSKHLLVSTFLR